MARLFVGVIPSGQAREDLDRAVAALHGRAGEPRWIPSERWHITLVFLGEVADPDRLSRELATVAAAPFSLRITAAGTFPARGTPAVLWAGIGGDVPALSTLARSARHAARRAHLPRDGKPFAPHLTLGRWRPADTAGREFAAALAHYSGPEFRVEAMTLLHSHLGPKPWYETIESFPLG